MQILNILECPFETREGERERELSRYADAAASEDVRSLRSRSRSRATINSLQAVELFLSWYIVRRKYECIRARARFRVEGGEKYRATGPQVLRVRVAFCERARRGRGGWLEVWLFSLRLCKVWDFRGGISPVYVRLG